MTSGNSVKNRRARTARLLTLITIGAGPLATSAWAQSSGSDNQSLDTVTVTSEAITTQGDTPPPAYAGGQVAAGGRIGILGEQDAMDVPFNVISYTSDLIENQQANTLGDVLTNDASVSVGRGYGVYGESFKLRGFDLYGDDISFGGLYGVLPRQLIDTSMMERVEVFKGASAFANGIPIGGSGVGGSVNIEPKRATDEPITRLSTGYTSDGYVESGLDAGRRFGDQNQFGARISVKRGRGDHAIDDEESADTSAILGLDYRGDRARASLDIGHQKNTIDGARSSVYVTDPALDHIPHAPSSDINYTPDWAETHLETTFGMLRGEYDITDNWTAFAAVGGNKTHEYLASPVPTLNDSNGSATLGGVLPTRNEISTFAGQAGVRGHFDTGSVSHQLNLAYSNFYRNFDTSYDYYTYGSATSIYDPSDIDKDDGVGGPLGGSVTHTRAEGTSLSDTLGFFDDRVLLTLGARYQEIHINTERDATEERGNRVTPVYGIVYKATDEISLYANHIEALQSAGTVTSQSASNYGSALGIAHSKQNEVGAKFDYGTFGGAIALFEIEQPSVATHADGSQSLDNEQRNRGVELSAYGAPLDGIRVLASATFIDPELTKTQDDTEGNDAAGVPDYQYALSGEWDIPHVDRLTATGRFLQSGSQYVAADNDLKLDSWSRLDLGMRYIMPVGQADWIWRVGIDNVTDEDYWASASTAGSGYITQGEPRTFKVSATVDF